MSERSFTANGNTGGGRVGTMHRRLPDGTISKPLDVDYNQYVNPPRGARGRFRLNGWSPFYETQSTFNGETKTVKRTRAEYLIVKMSGMPELDGKLFGQSFPVPKNIDNENSKLGQFLSALLGVKTIPKGMTIDLDSFIDSEFVTSVTRDDVTGRDGNEYAYCGIAWDVIDPTKTKLSPYVNGYQATSQTQLEDPEPALVGAAVGGDDANPFETDDSDDL